MKRRAIVFCIVAIILLVLTHAVFALWVGDYTWYEHDPRVSIVTIILAIIYVFFPFAASKTLSLFLEIPLGIIALAEILGCYILVVLICSLEVGVAISILYITGSVLILGGYTLGDYTVGGPLVASIGTIAFVMIVLLFGIRFYKTTRKLVKNTWYSLWHIFEAWVPYPGRLMVKIWDIATQLGELVVGRVYFMEKVMYRWFDKALDSLHQKRYDEAIRWCDKIIIRKPTIFLDSAYCTKGNALLEMGRYSDANDCLDQAVRLSRTFGPAWLRKGEALLNLGEYEEALKCEICATNSGLSEDQRQQALDIAVEALKHLEIASCPDCGSKMKSACVKQLLNLRCGDVLLDYPIECLNCGRIVYLLDCLAGDWPRELLEWCKEARRG